jgi:hypothetical protein
MTNLSNQLQQYRELFPGLCKLFRLLLVIPATSATSEGSFSSVKTYLRTTMKQERLNHLLLLHIHKDRKIDLTASMREYVLHDEDHLCLFGKF